MSRFHRKEDVLPRMLGMWPSALMKLCNLPQSVFNKKHQPCPYCGGKDRFRWTDKIERSGDGGNICTQCGNDSGIGLFMRLRGENYSETINTLGEWLNLVPVEVVNKANKAAKRDLSNLGAYADHDKCMAVMARTQIFDKTDLSVYEGFYSNDGYSCGVSKDGQIIHALPCHVVHGDGLDEEMCNIMFVDEYGNSSFYAQRPTRGSVVKTGSTNGAIYLCTDWVFAQHVHLFTGQEVWTCFSAYNLENVAYRYKGDRTMRVVCNKHDRDVLIAAEERDLDVMFPYLGIIKLGVEKKLYKPSDFL